MPSIRLARRTRAAGLLATAGTAAILAAAFAPAAFAQVAAAAPAVEEGDIVVTAQRRNETLQDVPLSVTAISPQRLENLNIRSVASLTKVTPALVFDNGTNFAQTFIRGVGTQFNTPGLETSVATYIDGAYLTRGYGTIFDMLDTQTVQVLKGPQGTLYGRNATGGVILLNSADPTFDFDGHLLAEYGRFNHMLGEAVVNAPLSEDVAVRFAGRYTSDDGFIKNLTLGTKDNAVKSYVVRGKVKWQLGDEAFAVLGLEKSRQRINRFAHHNFVEAPQCLACAITGVGPVEGRYTVRNELEGPATFTNMFSANLHLNWVSGDVTFDSVTAFRDIKGRAVNDLDGEALPLFIYDSSLGGKSYTHDMTVSTSSGGLIDGLFGVSFLRDEGYFEANVLGLAFQPVFDAVGNFPTSVSYANTTSISAFGEVTIRPAPGLSLIGGLRYTYDDRELKTSLNPGAQLAFSGGTAPAYYHQTANFNAVTPRATIAYDFGTVNVYATYNKGFKAGGFNTPSFAPAPAVLPEKIESYEIGLKFRSPDGALSGSIAAFQYDHSDVQVTVIDLASGGNQIRNAAAAEGKGIEAELNLRIAPRINVFAGGAYLDAKYKSFPNAQVHYSPATGNAEDLTGRQVPRAPKWTGFVGIDATVPAGDAWQGKFNAVGRYSSAYDFYPGAGGPFRYDRQPETFLADMSASVGPADGRYEIGVYVNNVFDDHYYSQIQSSDPFGVYKDPARPRTFGARLKYNF